MEIEVSCIIIAVGWDELLSYTKLCFDSLIKNTSKELLEKMEIILVIDEPEEQTMKWLFEISKKYKARLIINQERIGVAKAFNAGIAISNGKYLLLLCNDMYVRPNCVESLLELLKAKPEYGWVSAGNPQTKFSALGCALISREAINKVGLLDENFSKGFGYEDDDYYMRFRLKGYEPHGCLDAFCDHPQAQTTMRVIWKEKLIEANRRNAEYFAKKYGIIGIGWDKIPADRLWTVHGDLKEGCKHVPTSYKDLVSIIILNWNLLEKLKECLESIKENTDIPYEVIVVDQGSNDGSLEYLKSLDWIKLVSLKENVGVPKGYNIGMDHANPKSKFFMFLNNDCKVCKGWLEAMVSLAKSDEKIGIVGPKALVDDRRVRAIGGSINLETAEPKLLYEFHDKDDPMINKPIEVDYVDAAILVKREVIDKIGKWDERFSPCFFENTDLCVRAKLAGYKVVYCPNSIVYHFHPGPTVRRLGVDKYMQINKQRFFEKWSKIKKVETNKESDRGLKLNLFCGNESLKGYINIDIKPPADMVCDCTKLDKIKDESVDEILCYHGIEHLPLAKVDEAIKEWKRKLKKGGKLVLEVPDLEEICKIFINAKPSERWESYNNGPALINHIYGSQANEYEFHKSGYTKESLITLLNKHGFSKIKFGESHKDYKIPCIHVEAIKNADYFNKSAS